jgi:hypothetical protein
VHTDPGVAVLVVVGGEENGSFDLHGWSTSDMNVQVGTCDGLLAPWRASTPTALDYRCRPCSFGRAP